MQHTPRIYANAGFRCATYTYTVVLFSDTESSGFPLRRRTSVKDKGVPDRYREIRRFFFFFFSLVDRILYNYYGTTTVLFFLSTFRVTVMSYDLRHGRH